MRKVLRVLVNVSVYTALTLILPVVLVGTAAGFAVAAFKASYVSGAGFFKMLLYQVINDLIVAERRRH